VEKWLFRRLDKKPTGSFVMGRQGLRLRRHSENFCKKYGAAESRDQRLDVLDRYAETLRKAQIAETLRRLSTSSPLESIALTTKLRNVLTGH